MKNTHNISQEEFETIEKYLNNRLSMETKISFEKAIYKDASLAIKVEEVKKLLIGIEAAVLKNNLDTYHEELQPLIKQKIGDSNVFKTTKKINGRIILYSIAASIAIALGIFWFLKDITSTEKLFAKYFTPDPGLPTVMGTTSEYDFYEGMVDYKRKEYTVAINKWKKLLPLKENNDTLDYFLGVAYLAEGNAEKSLEYLEPTQKFSTGIFKEDAIYYTALAKLKKGELEASKKILKENPSEKNTSLLKRLPN